MIRYAVILSAVLLSSTDVVAQSPFAISDTAAGDDFAISWSGTRGLQYDVEVSTNLVTWGPLTTTIETNRTLDLAHDVAFYFVRETAAIAVDGLMWCITSNLPYDLNLGDTVGGIYGEGRMAWANANTFCEHLNAGGYSDWRLPTRDELTSMLTFAPNTLGFVYPHPREDYFWSSTASGDSHHWRVRRTSGAVNT